MGEAVLDRYIAQHLETCGDGPVLFSWHGGEPTLLGVDYYRRVVELQQLHKSPGQRIVNGMQTNGTLLDETWCRFLAKEKFSIGISIDGPQRLHDLFRRIGSGKSCFSQCLRGYELLRQFGVSTEILCVVHAENVRFPREVYEFLKNLGAEYLSFLPLVEREERGRARSVPSEVWGDFLIEIFDIWKARDIGKVKIQIFEEALRPAFGQEHTLCIFKETCGAVPVLESNGDFYACDHFVSDEYRIGNILETPLFALLGHPAQRAFGVAKRETLPEYCRSCEVRDMCNGGCPKNRFARAPDGEPGLNYLCAGYKKFFSHCRPLLEEIASLWRIQNAEAGVPGGPDREGAAPKIGRNQPCPCGSGRKYKHCCLRENRL